MIVSKSADKPKSSDQELIDAYQSSGDLEILGVLYERYIHLVYGVCLKYLKNREDSKDAVMSIFEKLVADLMKHEVQNFGSWVYVAAKNFCLMKLRSAKHRMEVGSVEINSNPNMEMEVSMHPSNEKLEDDLQMLEKCIEELKSDQGQAVKLFFLEQKCYQEISKVTGFDVKKVKSYIQNGKRNLKICVEKKREQV